MFRRSPAELQSDLAETAIKHLPPYSQSGFRDAVNPLILEQNAMRLLKLSEQAPCSSI
jgi:hypothetical protein